MTPKIDVDGDGDGVGVDADAAEDYALMLELQDRHLRRLIAEHGPVHAAEQFQQANDNALARALSRGVP